MKINKRKQFTPSFHNIKKRYVDKNNNYYAKINKILKIVEQFTMTLKLSPCYITK